MKVRLEPLRWWYQDLCSCLQCAVASVLEFHRVDPLAALGSGWSFQVRPGEWEPVEFFHPAGGDDLARALAPNHPLHAEWHRPAGAEAAEAEVVAALREGRPVIVAVDNYHLPFRPAYHDVHAGHLVVLHGFDLGAGTFDVLDAMPPAFKSPLPATVLRESRGSTTPGDGSDPFFSGSSFAHRWLGVVPTGPAPDVDRDWVRSVLAANREGFEAGSDGDGGLAGLAGLRRYLDDLPRRAGAEGSGILQEVYVVGWAVQASTALHADFLTMAADRLRWPRLAEAARWVDRVAHDWTPLRMAAAHGLRSADGAARQLRERGRELAIHWLEALDRIDAAVGAG